LFIKKVHEKSKNISSRKNSIPQKKLEKTIIEKTNQNCFIKKVDESKKKKFKKSSFIIYSCIIFYTISAHKFKIISDGIK